MIVILELGRRCVLVIVRCRCFMLSLSVVLLGCRVSIRMLSRRRRVVRLWSLVGILVRCMLLVIFCLRRLLCRRWCLSLCWCCLIMLIRLCLRLLMMVFILDVFSLVV